MSKHKIRPVDMSAPEGERRRRRQRGMVGGTPPAQLSHAQGSRGARWARDGARKLAAMEALRGDAADARLAEAEKRLLPDVFTEHVLARIREDNP